ncbi:MAG: ABC transporter ATP-binding protein [Candidatus Theseobacter exili]|nr:ABC transporter ATP-binding protein [Candidatus Theseobacter exili]
MKTLKSEEIALKIINIYKVFPIPANRFWSMKKGSVSALKGINLSFNKSEHIALLGPNGAGKTTLLRLIAGVLTPTECTIEYWCNNENTTKRFRPKTGFVTSDERSFFWRLTGYENLEFFAYLYNLHKKNIRERISEVLHMVAFKDKSDKLFQNYSSGNKKKLSIARGLLCNPDILLLDEATNSLDPVDAEEIKVLVSGLSESGSTVVWTTHRLEEAEQIADRVVLLDTGVVKYDGSKDQFVELVEKEKTGSLLQLYKELTR